MIPNYKWTHSVKRKACLLIGFFFFWLVTSFGQNQAIADSVKKLLTNKAGNDSIYLAWLKLIAVNEQDPVIKEQFADQLIQQATEKKSYPFIISGYMQKGNADRLQGNMEAALSSYFKGLEIAVQNEDFKFEGSVYSSIADIYSISGNKKNAFTYYNKSIAALRKFKDDKLLGIAIQNAGDEYLNNKIFDTALLYFKECWLLFEKAQYLPGKAYTLGNLGIVYANLGNKELAEKNINDAIHLLEGLEDYYPICVYLLSMSDIYLEKNDQPAALAYAKRSLNLAMQHGLKEQISDANLKLSELYEKSGNTTASLIHYKDYIAYRDSINNIKSVQAMADLRTDYEVSRKQTEVDLLNQQKKNQRNVLISLFIILGLVTVILGTLFWYYKAIAREKKRSESLLLNILPAETAKELKQFGKVEAVKFDAVTVLFTDFVKFSKLAEHVEPEQLVKSIDFYFKKFDDITTKYGLEKIKTVGDAYMCAGGLPTTNPAHAKNVILAAREIVQFVSDSLNNSDGLTHFEIRAGIHTGPVIAGIVGIKKWQYDIWGDTVNIAARMESASQPGRINISESTYLEIKDEFPCEYRGEIEVKNRGLLKMYFIT